MSDAAKMSGGDLLAANHAARAEVLRRVCEGLAAAGSSSEGRGAAGGAPPLDFTPVSAPRPAPFADLKARFIACARASATTLDEVSTRAQVPAAVARYLSELNLPHQAENQTAYQAAIWAELADLDWAGSGIEVAVRAAHGSDAVGITGVFCAIAETGSILVHAGPDTAATTSLLPDTHIAVVPVSRLVSGMEAAFALLKTEQGDLPRSVNLISGPSRTGDIELTIVLGAHGPYRVHLILLND